jgi:hypothetical protein
MAKNPFDHSCEPLDQKGVRIASAIRAGQKRKRPRKKRRAKAE